MDSNMDDDSAHRVIAMHTNRPQSGVKDTLSRGPKLPSPGQIGGGAPPFARDRAGDTTPEPDTTPLPAEPDYQPPPKKSDPLPRPGDAYWPHARFLNRLSSEQRLIHFVDKECWSEGFAYSDLRRLRWVSPESEGSGPAIELLFVDTVITTVRIEGRHLEDIHFWISEGTMPWVREQPANYKTKDDNAVVITRITIKEEER